MIDYLAPPLVVICICVAIGYFAYHPEVLKSPTLIPDIVVATVALLMFIFIYLKILQPQVRIGKYTTILQKCPDRWVYDEKTGMCSPTYRTPCVSFSASDPNLQSYDGQCKLATRCGTNWGKACER